MPPSAAYLDCKGLRCPMPIVQVSLAMRTIPPGGSLAIEATDPAFRPDLTAWARQTGHTIESFTEGEIQFAVISKPAAAPAGGEE